MLHIEGYIKCISWRRKGSRTRIVGFGLGDRKVSTAPAFNSRNVNMVGRSGEVLQRFELYNHDQWSVVKLTVFLDVWERSNGRNESSRRDK